MMQPQNILIVYLLYAIKLTRVEEATQDIIHFQKRMHLCNFLRSNKPLRCFVPPLALHLIFSFIHTVRCRTQPQTPWLVETNFLRNTGLCYICLQYSLRFRRILSLKFLSRLDNKRGTGHTVYNFVGLRGCMIVELIVMASG